MNIVYLNGAYLPREEARVSVDDRGFVFGDGVYEFTPLYRGRSLRLESRLERLRRGLRSLMIDYDAGAVPGIYAGLIERNRLAEREAAALYIQVTRGTGPRTHAFQRPAAAPTVYAFPTPLPTPDPAAWEAGLTAVTVPDTRWGRVDLKTLQLLPNVLAQEAAVRAGADEAILVRDGLALEGGRSNLFTVLDGIARTHPASNQILPGITRAMILELAAERGCEIREMPTPVDALADASEVFMTGSSTEIKSVVQIDGRPVGDGAPGPVARELYGALREAVASGRLEG
ncbi:MAG: aminotransferase class IV [Gammaproteobacteria bacterium]|nr:aminotransferase class IV [Gammaproteobacteria bacterium]MDE0246638.1 aminotransferase class IV [Gammaproteobacteria bacterium]